jgi:hypothetical protein
MRNGKVVLFADNTNILVIEKNRNALQDKIDKVMMQLETWFSMNTMVINSITVFSKRTYDLS